MYKYWLLIFGECLINGFCPFFSVDIPGFRALLTSLTSLHEVREGETILMNLVTVISEDARNKGMECSSVLKSNPHHIFIV